MSIKIEELKVDGEYVSRYSEVVVKYIGDKYVTYDLSEIGKDDWKESSGSITGFINTYSLKPVKRKTIELIHCYDICGSIGLYDNNGNYPLFSDKQMSVYAHIDVISRPVKGLANVFIDAETFEMVGE